MHFVVCVVCKKDGVFLIFPLNYKHFGGYFFYFKGFCTRCRCDSKDAVVYQFIFSLYLIEGVITHI